MVVDGGRWTGALVRRSFELCECVMVVSGLVKGAGWHAKDGLRN